MEEKINSMAQREIKFRAWSVEQKAYIAGFNMVNFHSYYNKGLEPEIYRYSTTWKLSEIILQQYTGLNDTNGDAIYEGDIIMDISGNKLVVEWNDDTCKFQFSDGSDINDRDRYATHKQIVGNILQNPESIKV